MEPGQQALHRVEPRGADKVEFLQHKRSKGFQDGTGTQYSLPGTCCVFCIVKNHCIKLCVPHCIGQDSQAVCVVYK